MFERTKELLDLFLAEKVPGYDTAVFKDGKCVFRQSGGYVDMEKKTTHTGKELYNMYSCSKTVTCVAAMMLYERGAFKLDDKLSKYIPEYENMMVKTEDGLRPATTDILIEDVFGMTAGFHYTVSCPSIKAAVEKTEGRCPTLEIARCFASEPLEFDPGTSWKYSFGHDILAALVEVWSGVRFADFVRDNIFAPLGMTSSTFHITEEDRKSLCTQYKYDYSTKLVNLVDRSNVYDLGPEYDSGGAGMVSTVDDFIKFGEALRKGEIIKSETIKLMTKDRLSEARGRGAFYYTDYGYGLGVRCPRLDGDACGEGIYDFGWGGAAGALFGVDIEHGITVFHAQHILNFPNFASRAKLMRAVTADILGTESKEIAQGEANASVITY